LQIDSLSQDYSSRSDFYCLSNQYEYDVLQLSRKILLSLNVLLYSITSVELGAQPTLIAIHLSRRLVCVQD